MSKRKYFLAIDQGTSSSRAILYDENLIEQAKSQIEFKQYYPQKGWVEHDPEEIFFSELIAIKTVLAQLDAGNSEIYAGITNQRETVIIWDRETSEPVYPAIVWQDTRTTDYCIRLKQNTSFCNSLREKTGLVMDTYFSATKIKWILDSDPNIRARAERGNLACGTIDSWLMWKLSQAKVHKTDFTNASRTMLFNIKHLRWDDELLASFNIPKCLMPEVFTSQADFLSFNLDGFNINVKAVAGDQSASLFGHGCFNAGEAKCTFGTGAFFLLNTGTSLSSEEGRVAERTSSRLRRTNDRSVFSIHEDHEDNENAEIVVPRHAQESDETPKLLKTIAFSLANGMTYYALEGSIFIAGSGINWLKNSLNCFNSASETESMAYNLSEEAMDGLYLVPAFTGLGAPYWDMNARAAILGMSLDTGKPHLVRAMLSAVAYQIKDLVLAVKDINLEKFILNVDGGLAANNFLLEFMAGILSVEVNRNLNLELTAQGIVMMVAHSLGDYGLSDLKALHENKIESFTEAYSTDKIKKLYAGWCRAVASVRAYGAESI